MEDEIYKKNDEISAKQQEIERLKKERQKQAEGGDDKDKRIEQIMQELDQKDKNIKQL